jgi:1-deoxy-D-xylulose-5-phosphate synthase
MIIYSPLSEIGLQNILHRSTWLRSPNSHPLSSWSWRSTDWQTKKFGNYEKIEIGRAHCLKHGTETAVLSTYRENVTLALANLNKTTIAHYDFAFVKPLDEKNYILFLKLSKRL